MDTVLSVQGAKKRYGSIDALRDADLSLDRGKWLGLLGPNGAGKTTLIRAIAGRVKLDEGELRLFGTTLNGNGAVVDELRSRLGVVPQDVALYPLLNARENLQAFGRLHGVNGAALNTRVEWALQWTDLADRAKEKTSGFSGGMKRRLNLACSVLHEPEVLLLDEPTVGVDPQSRQRIWEMLGELKQGGTSILLTTHNLDEAQQVCERIVIIDHGEAIASGNFAELLKQTIGAGRRVIVHADLDDDTRKALAGNPKLTVGDDTIETNVDDIATDLHALLDELKRAGVRVSDLHVESPTLQAVFLHLTGRELRE